MKRISILISLLLITIAIYAQQNNSIDVVYLKNGSVLKGIIVEQVPNESIKLQTSDGSIFVYQTDEIDKIVKEMEERQPTIRKGYIGLSLGPSFGVGNASGIPTGMILNLVDFGYLFTDHIGIAAKWFGTAHPEGDLSFGVGGIIAGLLVSTPINEKLNFEGRALIGPTVGVLIDSFGDSETTEAYMGYNLGAGLRFNTSQKVSLLLNVDYLGVYEYKSVNITFGVGYRLR